jgi:hypothetical protein
VLAFPAAAAGIKPVKQYVLKHPKHGHCRKNYWKRVETVKKREHHKTVKVKEAFCVYITPKETAAKAPATTTPTHSSPTPVGLVTLHAHLDPSFVQSATNPLAVTYRYSASATETINGVPNPNPNLPSGVLNLHSDGLLVCSINVGGSTTGGECPVTYGTTGAHTVVTTYVAGTTSATETDTEQINPFSTTTAIAASAWSSRKGKLGETWDALELTPSVVGQYGVVLTPAPFSGPHIMITMTDEANGSHETFAGSGPLVFSIELGSPENGYTEYAHGEGYKETGGHLTLTEGDELAVTATYSGSPGYAPSSSLAAVTTAPPN